MSSRFKRREWGEEAQRIISARIAKDNKAPLWGKPMSLKEGRNKTREGRINPTIWDAQQGGLACICDPSVLAQRVKVHDSAYHLVEERRVNMSMSRAGRGAGVSM